MMPLRGLCIQGGPVPGFQPEQVCRLDAGQDRGALFDQYGFKGSFHRRCVLPFGDLPCQYVFSAAELCAAEVSYY